MSTTLDRCVHLLANGLRFVRNPRTISSPIYGLGIASALGFDFRPTVFTAITR